MYEVNWCLVGQDPESEPFMFDTYERALNFLTAELTWMSRDWMNPEYQVDVKNAIMDLKAAHYLPERPQSFTIGQISYWVVVYDTAI